MTRELKFRAWDGRVMTHDVTIFNGRYIDCSCADEDVFYKWHDPSEQVAIMQFTGLKDRNGKEIWEGDIIRNERGDWGVIVYKAPAFEVTVSEDQSSLYTKEWIEACEVIGNIYENQDDKNKNRS